ncbi:MAG: dipeptidyl-peptidase-4 [Mariniblastus sp.]|jgi:dipeptidyl-peptidase-4
MTRFASLTMMLLAMFVTTQVVASQKTNKNSSAQEKASKTKGASTELELKELFPEKSMFGPSARNPEFSNDGRFAAYLYRSYDHRRHGMDLWIYDFKTSKQTQITNVAMMSEFQRSARKVKEDRIAKHKKALQEKEADKKKLEAKKAGKTKSSSDDDNQEKEAKSTSAKPKKKTKQQLEKERQEEFKIVISVSEKDADAEKSPRYSGVSSFQWHPTKNSLLISSESDIYHIDNIEKPKLDRLTKTAARESRVDFLPDGSGYTYESSDAVMRVNFDSHLIEQINPRLDGGQSLSRYSISPDGKRLVVVGRTGERSGSDRKVDIIRYRDRFAKSDSISRTVSDDTITNQKVNIYLYDLETADTEEAKLIHVFENEIDEPRDVISTPKWSPDSQKVTFCFFDQKNSEVQIMLASLPTEEELKKKKSDSKSKDSDEKTDEESSSSRSRSSGPETIKHDAKVVYRFKHYGGPNTPSMVAPDFAGDSKHIVFISEQSGYRHVHLLDPLYESVRQLTSGQYEVYPVRFSEDHQHLFVTATKESAARQMVYTLDLNSGEMKRLNKDIGTFSSVAVSNDGQRLMGNFVRYGQLTELVCQNEKRLVKTLTDSHPQKAKDLTKIKPEFFDYKNRHGHTISGMMFKPAGWKKTKKHPLLIYVYGGPLGSRHSVNDGSYSSDGYFFQMYMARKHGYVTIVVDPRGQSGYGGLFEKSNFEQVGKPQVEDLVDSVKFMTESYNIDNKRVGLYGWSFGGFQTQKCLYTQPDVFQVGMAGAGPTQWENYNSWYTTGTVGPSREGKTDQAKYSLIPLAKDLKGKLLLVHGMEDTNVLFQDTVAVYRALLKAGKETNVELFLDPTGGHGLGGDIKRLGRMRKYEQFLLRTIGKGN